jgi:hypothetical protein
VRQQIELRDDRRESDHAVPAHGGISAGFEDDGADVPAILRVVA